MARVIVFGGSGFLGSHVADELTDRGHEVTLFDLKKSIYLKENQKMIIGDIQDQKQIRKAMKGMNFVFHFAGIADIKEAQENPVETVKTNILSTAYILDACKEHKIDRILYASTIYVYSEHGSFYRSSKQAAELLIENYHKIYNLDYTILRYGSLYGKRANHFNTIHNFIKEAILTGKITRKGDGSEIRDYINVIDAARATVDLLNSPVKNEYVLLTGNQTMKIQDILNMICEIFENKVSVEYVDEKMEEHYDITPYNFKPKVARKYVLNYYHDLGQGVLESIYDVYTELSKENNQLNISIPKSAEY